MRIVSPEEARRIAVRAQLLDGSATSLLDTVRTLGFLQIDPISTVAPPQYLVPWSRLGASRRESGATTPGPDPGATASAPAASSAS